MSITLIAIIGKNKVLGKDNKLIFKIPGDLPRFKQITTGHPIVMGRKTFESFGSRALPNRTNIVISRTTDPLSGVLIVRSLEEALDTAKDYAEGEEVFVIGGGQIYKEAISFADRLNLTIVDKEEDGDTFFPDYSEFKKIISKEDHETPDGLKFSYVVLEK